MILGLAERSGLTSFFQATDHLMVRKGSSKNVMVFPEADYDADALAVSDGKYTYTHNALGADKFRYTWNFGKNWTTWTDYEDTTSIDSALFKGEECFWEGDHIIVQCASDSSLRRLAVLTLRA
jgi:alpha-1,3-glucan synthase